MSTSGPSVPTCALTLGSVNVPEADIISTKIHLGCSTEVSSFEVVLQNWNGKYSPNGSHPIIVGVDGGCGLCRLPNNPANSAVISLRVESIKYESTSTESYLRISGRCWGEKLFRRVVTKTYENKKGEEIVKDLLDNYALLSHVRDSVELVEDTDTTYTKLEYEDTPLWDVLKYIAESADKAGVIGFDFRIAPDGKFEFFPKNSKTNTINLTDKIEDSNYRKDIHRIRNKITIRGEADKSYPLNKDAWTEILNPSDGVWTAGLGNVAQDSVIKFLGESSIKCQADGIFAGSLIFTLNDGKEVDCNKYPVLAFATHLAKSFGGSGLINLYDAEERWTVKYISVSADEEWHTNQFDVGHDSANKWDLVPDGFNWAKVKKLRFLFFYPSNGQEGIPVGWGDFHIDNLFFGGNRFSAVVEDAISQGMYGLREYVETDEELWSDNECELRAKALLAYLKSPAEYVTIYSSVLDYGTSPVLPGERIQVILPNENVNDYFRVEAVDYSFEAKEQTLEVNLELGKVPPKMADYLYGLRTFTVNVEKLARTKTGKRGISLGNVTGGVGTSNTGVFPSTVTFKDTGNVLIDMVPTNVAAPSGQYIDVFASVISPLDHTTVLTDPMLCISQALFLEKDFQTFGFLGTASDPFKQSGGGAILMGQGFTGLYCPPMFSLTGTIIHSGDPLGSYQQGVNFPSEPVDMQWFYHTGNKTLYQRINNEWVSKYTDVLSGAYDTLFLIRGDYETPANLYLNTLSASQLSLRGIGGATSNFTVGISDGVRYLIPDGATKTLGIGTDDHRLAFVNTAKIYVDEFHKTDGSLWEFLTVLPTVHFGDTDFADQNLLKSSDAIFRSVLAVMPSGVGAGFKLGSVTPDVTYLALGYDGTNVYVTAYQRHLDLVTEIGKRVRVAHDIELGGNVYLSGGFQGDLWTIGTMKANGGYLSADGSAGQTFGPVAVATITVKNGLIVGHT